MADKPLQVVIAARARDDILSILTWTHENFGPQIARRYTNLIETAVGVIADDPCGDYTVARPEVAKNCRTFHLFHCRKKAGKRGNTIRKPRHFLLYRVTSDGTVEIGRVLHDSMELENHLPDEYRE